jgi:hypothetical protein
MLASSELTTNAGGADGLLVIFQAQPEQTVAD